MTTLGKYEVHEVIGKGGFGTVYRATDATLGRVVAIKVLNPAWMAEGSEAVERFRREARIMAQLEHPNVATIHEVGEERGMLYIVMRYLPGKSLAERLKAGPLSVDLVLRILRDVCAGLQSAHAQGWVHRDLKPANILFDIDGRAVLTDFGLARAVQISSIVASSSGTVGTPFYRAPELWRGKPPASPATDVYSLGCILGEMLTGRPLFGGDTPDEVLTKHLIDGPDFGKPWPPAGVSVEVVGVVEKALQRDPVQRHASAADFWMALQTASQAKPAGPRVVSRTGAVLPTTPNVDKQDLVITLPGGVKMEFVRVPAGKFTMGSNNGESREKPAHEVHLDEYWMGKYPVTNAQFQAYVNATKAQTTAEVVGYGWIWNGKEWAQTKGADWRHPSGPDSSIDGREEHPVVQVSWEDAKAFCDWLSGESGQKIALPSEAQWEKAARGTDGRTYPWGSQAPDATRCNFGRNIKNTTPVGQYSPQGDSPYGCADLAGNVWEWCADWYDENYYGRSPQSNPAGPASGNYRVLRGGGWISNEYYLRSSSRFGLTPGFGSDDFGFRCSRSSD